MKLLHTADWHLGRRQSRIDRAEDLRRAVDQIMSVCVAHDVDVLIIAGDLFEDGSRPDVVQAATAMLKAVVGPFLRGGGTILAVAGNHDGETLCQTIGNAFDLAAPTAGKPGSVLARGRFHLFSRPTFHRLEDRAGQVVQFVLMPYPTPHRYLDGGESAYPAGGEGRNRHLRDEFSARLARIRHHHHFDAGLHSVLVSHLFLSGAMLPGGRVITASDEGHDIVGSPAELSAGWAYVALGHVHKAQALSGLDHVRYAGSIDRLDFSERDDAKEVVLLELGPAGLCGQPASIPLAATPYLAVEIDDPATELPTLAARHPDAATTLVSCRATWTAGRDDPDAIRRQVQAIFPRCYAFDPIEAGRAGRTQPQPGHRTERRAVRATVLDYLRGQLEGHELAEAVLAEADSLINEVQP